MDNYGVRQSISQANAHLTEEAQRRANQSTAALSIVNSFNKLKSQQATTNLEAKGLEMLKVAGAAGVFKAKIGQTAEALADPSYVNPFTRASRGAKPAIKMAKDAVISARTQLSAGGRVGTDVGEKPTLVRPTLPKRTLPSGETRAKVVPTTESTPEEITPKSPEEVANKIGGKLTAGLEGVGAAAQFEQDVYSEASGGWSKENVGEKIGTIANQVGTGIVEAGLATGDVPLAAAGEAITLGSDIVRGISDLFEQKDQARTTAAAEKQQVSAVYTAPIAKQQEVISEKAL